MSKATIQDVVNEGFNAIMFGGDANFLTASTGTVQVLLDRAENWVKAKVTAANFATSVANTYVDDCLIAAERCWASWQLWIRRIQFLDQAATNALEADKKAKLLEQARTNATNAQQDALYWLGEAQRVFGMDVQADLYGTGASSGMLETGMFPQTQQSALNYGGAQ